MKLYYSPGACSLSPHIVLRESGLAFELEKVDLKIHRTEDGTDFYTVNPKGPVPVLEIANGERLTEGPAIIQYIADQVPGKSLAPANGTMPRYRLQEWLNFITSELHKGFSPLFSPTTPDQTRSAAKAKLGERLAYVDGRLANQDYLLGDSFSVADAYLYAVTSWAGNLGVEIGHLAHLKAFLDRMTSRPAVQQALQAEGLLK